MYGVIMKKLFSFFVLCVAAAPVLAAVSTCETRVDKHQDASTAERVDYCLTEEPQEADDTPVTEVVLSDVYSVQYPKPKTKKSATEQEVTKTYTQQPISQEYIDRDDYPAFRNDILPRLNDDSAHAVALEALGHSQEKTGAKGSKSLTKPARQMKAAPATQEEAPAEDAWQAASPTAPAAAYTIGQNTTAYPAYSAGVQTTPAQNAALPAGTAQTPAAEIQQAQALQNDPLYQNNTANGAAPAGFTDGGVMGQSGFGYNATDPAFQP